MDKITILTKKTDELSSDELLQIMQERVKVFVVEQNCPYQEIDDKDFQAHHMMLFLKDQLAAYCRIIPHDDVQYMSIGRVLVVKEFRGYHFASQMLKKAILETLKIGNNKDIKIAAQSYLQSFYHSLGFKPVSDVYLEDNIPHLDMIYSPS
ncbi:GNAT family N-acetyltransferase [Xylocopilactobacillus apis]|uniref:Acetyltransferase n=1 Tax=Xylocopilactobacillus apis TaxID=2932183 RepID=A0AAU9D7M1_9LACO|nr:GNAT family N-acetyltransferase [Xylocopilactobacillus apis]BDR56777.1 acetyltransferase [Xylocopilactobacillus apis]